MPAASRLVVRTKLHPPVSPAGALQRQRLLDLLQTRAGRRLVLVAAPAGFGKTTFMGQWYETLRATGKATCWLSLDHQDTDPVRLLHHLVACVQGAVPGLGNGALQLVENRVEPDLEAAAIDLGNELAASDAALTLFLDDYHSPGSGALDAFVDRFVACTPPGVHLVIGSRVTPRLALPALRVRDELIEIQGPALRFDEAEATEFMRRVRGLDLAPGQLRTLLERAEGWVAGLQLVALALRDAGAGDDFIERFSGNFRDIADYLASDVLDRQPARVRDFLLRTAVLNRLCAGVCTPLTGDPHSQAMLERLEADQLFLVPLDQERSWYRYHHLFRDFLLGRLRRVYPAEIAGLYAQAADWFDSADLAAEAVDYALLSGDMDRVVRVVSARADAEMMRGRMPRVYSWINRIPAPIRERHPRLLIAQCMALYHMNRPDEAERILAVLQSRAWPDADVPGLPGIEDELRQLRAGIAMARDEVDRVLEPLAAPFASGTGFFLGVVENLRGYALAANGDFEAARTALDAARAHHQRSESPFGIVYADCFQALVDLSLGELHAVHERFAGAAADWREDYVRPVADLTRALVHYEWDQLEQAAALLEPGLPLIEQVGHVKLVTLAAITLARLRAARGEVDTALGMLGRLVPPARNGLPAARHRALVTHARVRLLLAHGRIAEAETGVPGLDPDPGAEDDARWERVSCLGALVHARLQIARGHGARALPLLARCRRLAAQAGRRPRLVEILILEALAQAERTPAAHRALAQALRLAAPAGLRRTFLDEGPALATLLAAHAEQPEAPRDGSARELLAALCDVRADEVARPHRPAGGACAAPLVESLSLREREVLRLLGDGASNGRIACVLAISENTVKWHIRNIFGKLGVPNRTAAVRAAQALGLIE